MQADMVIQVRTFDLMNWMCPKAENFPRAYRFTVTKRMLDALLDFQEGIVAAQSQRGQGRLKQLIFCDSRLTLLRLYLRLAHQWHWLSDGQYQYVSQMVAEIGRLLGGWIRQCKA